MLTLLLALIELSEAINAALAFVHEWKPLLAASAAAVVVVTAATDAVRTRVWTAVRTLSAVLPARPRPTPLTCPDARPETVTDARPDASGHGSGGGS
ncbi:hypothetical protein [Streptomyces afghaniensis]|uniref:hypothetical protein n=1 Tax=Streptomyces afghaniensis TaxID=66865 RepID=UPI00277DA9B7|nr:hypothetical protein [Streptomyces afghaniensis]MDQ1018806.1 hypothetical protein [Streptomyces afghaniensis]